MQHDPEDRTDADADTDTDDETTARRAPRRVKDDTRYAGTRPLAALVPGIARKAVGKRGFTDARILNEWSTIVGTDLARHCSPDRLTFPRGRREGATLHIRALGPMATELQHLEPVLVQRINAHFGYGAVAGIRLLQAPGGRGGDTRHKPPAPPPAAPDPDQLARMKQTLTQVEDPDLRAILERLGDGVLRRAARRQGHRGRDGGDDG